MLSRLRRLVGLQFRRVINKLSHFNCQLFGYKNGYNCYTTSFFSFNGINLFENLVSRELQRILQNFHFSISKHFDFTFHFSKKSESILFSLCTSRKRVKAFFFSFCTSRKRVKAFCFHFSLLELQKPTLAGPWSHLWTLVHLS